MTKNLKFILFSLMLGFGLASCMNHEFEPMTQAEQIQAKYDAAFITYIGEPVSTQTWGFGSVAASRMTRAASTWTDNHKCDWADKLNVVLPEGATKMTAPGWLSTGVYVVPTNGSVSLGWTNFNDGDKIYVLGNVTELKDANYNGTVTFYNVGTLTYSISSGNRHTIINTGTLTINSYGNVGEVYNSGTLNLVKTYNPYYQDPNAKADIPDAMSVFSTGEGSVLMPDGGDFKAAADIHGTLVANGNTKIQNSKTQYICGIKVDGVLDMTQGHLEASDIEATEIDFDGAEIWLTAGGHIKADVISMPNSATAIHEESTSTGFIEVGDIIMGNTNNFEDTFTSNIYFNITGNVDLYAATNIGDKAKKWNNVEDYLAAGYTVKGYTEGDNATGTPACGQPWSVGKTVEVTPETPADTITWKGMIIAEDLSANNASDFDFNDVVFLVGYKNDTTYVKILAAGGELPLYVAQYEIHEALGIGPKEIVNTGWSEAEPVELKIADTRIEPVDIQIIVYKDEELPLPLLAPQGKPAAKIYIPDTNFEWANERENLKEKYPKFKSYVEDENGPEEWWK